VLDLSRQPFLREPRALHPLRQLPLLNCLALSLTGCNWQLAYSTWTLTLAVLTSLTQLDLSGCDMAWVDGAAEARHAAAAGQLLDDMGSGSSRGDVDEHPAGGNTRASAGPGQPHGRELLPAPLQVLSRLALLQQVNLSGWSTLPGGAGACGSQLFVLSSCESR